MRARFLTFKKTKSVFGSLISEWIFVHSLPGKSKSNQKILRVIMGATTPLSSQSTWMAQQAHSKLWRSIGRQCQDPSGQPQRCWRLSLQHRVSSFGMISTDSNGYSCNRSLICLWLANWFWNKLMISIVTCIVGGDFMSQMVGTVIL